MADELNVRIEPANRGAGAFDLRHANLGRRVDHLALQIRQRDRVVVHHAERADAGSREIEQQRRAKSAGADHQHARALERRLAGAADLAQHDMAGVTLDLFRCEHGFLSSTPSLAHRRRFG
jgi:hypothetical protein